MRHRMRERYVNIFLSLLYPGCQNSNCYSHLKPSPHPHPPKKLKGDLFERLNINQERDTFSSLPQLLVKLEKVSITV